VILVYLVQDVFEGQICHSTGFKRATDHLGKKVVVVGAGSSGHDISYDCASNGVGKYSCVEIH
jgi:cation diffusion facilitator CzcD-associated flavoprotein CzcO